MLTHEKAWLLNEKVIEFIRELNEAFVSDPELHEITEHLKRVSKYLNNKTLKQFENGNKTEN